MTASAVNQDVAGETAFLAGIVPRAEGAYLDIDLDRLIAYTIHVLGGKKVEATFERIVMAAFMLFPRRFALVGFPDHPDAAKVNRALLHCRPKYRNYVTGRATTGFRLTQLGLGAAHETEAILAGRPSRQPTRRRPPPAPATKADRFMREVEASDAFRAYQTGRADEIEFYDICVLLHVLPSSPAEAIRENFKRLSSYAGEMRRDDVRSFLEWAAGRFSIG